VLKKYLVGITNAGNFSANFQGMMSSNKPAITTLVRALRNLLMQEIQYTSSAELYIESRFHFKTQVHALKLKNERVVSKHKTAIENREGVSRCPVTIKSSEHRDDAYRAATHGNLAKMFLPSGANLNPKRASNRLC